MKTTVDAIQFNQFGSKGPNDLLTMFAVRASELAQWAGIPRKGWRIRMLFQRWITEGREKELTYFWDAAANPDKTTGRYLLGPTAVIVAMQGTPNFKNGKLILEYNSPIDGLKSDAERLAVLAKQLLPRLQSRLANDEDSKTLLESFIKSPFKDSFPDVNHNYVLEFALQLAQMTVDAEKFIELNAIPPEELPSLVTSMEAICRPGIVVDGQHRLWGAASVDKEVYLPVVALSNCEWMDQIYQFVVINDKAQKVKSELLNDIFASSLTPTEQGIMRDKFTKVRVDIEKRIAGVLAGQEEASPFYRMVALDIPNPPKEMKDAFISQMIIQNLIDGGRGALGWRSDDTFYDEYVSGTFPNRGDWDSWQGGRWKEYWFAFWKTVIEVFTPQAKKAHNKDSSFEIWDKKQQTNLTKGVGLKMFQRFFMETMISSIVEEKKVQETVRKRLEKALGADEAAKQGIQALKAASIPESIDDFRSVVREILEKFPVTLFTANWLPSLDDSDGQERLLSAMKEAYSSDSFRARGRGVFES